MYTEPDIVRGRGVVGNGSPFMSQVRGSNPGGGGMPVWVDFRRRDKNFWEKKKSLLGLINIISVIFIHNSQSWFSERSLDKVVLQHTHGKTTSNVITWFMSQETMDTSTKDHQGYQVENVNSCLVRCKILVTYLHTKMYGYPVYKSSSRRNVKNLNNFLVRCKILWTFWWTATTCT